MPTSEQPNSTKQSPWGGRIAFISALAICAAGVAAYLQWWPKQDKAAKSSEPEAGHAAHGSPNSIELSVQARRNIGLTDEFIQPVKLQAFTKSITIPGIVAERPGWSIVQITAPFTGVVTRVYPIEGEAIDPRTQLFDLRLTHEDLVQSQADLLQIVAEQEVTDKEIARLEKLVADGTLPGKRLLELKYEKDKSSAVLRAKRQALLLHGLTTGQVDDIVEKRELFKEMTILASSLGAKSNGGPGHHLFQVQSIKVSPGQQVNAGDTLAVLADHAELYIQGEAFERDIAALNQLAESEQPVSAVMEQEGLRNELIENLQLLFLSTKVDPEKRTLDFYVKLPNVAQRDTKHDGRRFISWKYRPGQRVQLEIPIETLPNRIVLPTDAIAQDGTETYVFVPNGKGFERRSVHVEYRDPRRAVIANDGALFPGDPVALTAAQQLQVAIKNKSGGAPDPHAGHSH